MEKILKHITEDAVASAYLIIDEAKQIFKEQGIDQWQNGYPNQGSVTLDLENNSAFGLYCDGTLAAYCALVFEPDPNYSVIDGAWINQDRYATVHRFVVSKHFRNQGLAQWMMLALEDFVKANNVQSIRVDTHEYNPGMRRLLERLDYEYCGKVNVDDGERVAYEKMMK